MCQHEATLAVGGNVQESGCLKRRYIKGAWVVSGWLPPEITHALEPTLGSTGSGTQGQHLAGSQPCMRFLTAAITNYHNCTGLGQYYSHNSGGQKFELGQKLKSKCQKRAVFFQSF